VHHVQQPKPACTAAESGGIFFVIVAADYLRLATRYLLHNHPSPLLSHLYFLTFTFSPLLSHLYYTTLVFLSPRFAIGIHSLINVQ